ncbi:hypothetical protein FSZ31_04760 [Sphingorhabdus soli]|uniref:Uncharacterized protein n=1 Tax=Flavisphingopyxis soli TaxID=2601267 RepID=A0A5C6UTI4_9SPHN|nr:hypothetical protein [Sphingorhabdus soli]TXC74035.1 hypothetical protein FSZ31_04760 [Sphingorhabdus soli]
MDHETFPQGAPGADTPDALHDDRAPDAAPVLAALPAPDAPDPDDPSSAEAFGEGGATDAYGRTPDRWAGSGDPDDPTAGLTDREYDIYWAGVRDSIRLARHPQPGEAPSPLPQAGGAGGGHDGELASTELPTPNPSRLREGDYADPDDALVRPWLRQFDAGLRDADNDAATRDGGWNPRRKRVFLATLAASGIVTDACRAASISPRSAYNLRNRDAVFAEAWVAAQALARQRLADELLERALRGQADRIVKNGEVIAERHRTDNRLALGLLTRLDRLAAPEPVSFVPVDPAPHKVLMAHWDAFLDTIDAPSAEDDAIPSRAHPEPVEGASGETPEGHTQGHTREPVPGRCELHELVRTLEASGDSAPDPATAPASPVEADEDEHEIWQDSEGHWWTDFPPPEDFNGRQDGRYGDCDYQRTLDGDERFAVEEEDDEDRAERARLESLRRAAFGLPAEDEDEEDEEEDEEEEDGTQIPPRTGGVADDLSDQRDREAVEGHVTPCADIAKPGDSADTASPPPPPPIAAGPEPAAAQRLGDP